MKHKKQTALCWFARGGGISRSGPFDSQTEATNAIRLNDGGFPANAFVWPEPREKQQTSGRYSPTMVIESPSWRFDRADSATEMSVSFTKPNQMSVSFTQETVCLCGHSSSCHDAEGFCTIARSDSPEYKSVKCPCSGFQGSFDKMLHDCEDKPV